MRPLAIISAMRVVTFRRVSSFRTIAPRLMPSRWPSVSVMPRVFFQARMRRCRPAAPSPAMMSPSPCSTSCLPSQGTP